MKIILTLVLFMVLAPCAMAGSLFPASYSIKVVMQDYHLKMRPLSDNAIMRVTKDMLIDVATNKEFYPYFRKMEIIDNNKVIYQDSVKIDRYGEFNYELTDCKILQGASIDYFAYSVEQGSSHEHHIKYKVIRITKDNNNYNIIKFKELLPSELEAHIVFSNYFERVPVHKLIEGKYTTIRLYNDGQFYIANLKLEFTNTSIKEVNEELELIVESQNPNIEKETVAIDIYHSYSYEGKPIVVQLSAKSKIKVLGCKHRSGNPFSKDTAIHVNIDGHEGWIMDIDYMGKLGFQ